jgi:preprotein translocase subunit YajC
MWAIVPLILLVGFFFVFIVLPQRRQMQAAAAMQARLQVGDEVVTTSGIYGRLTRVDDDTVVVEVAPGTEVKLVRRAIGRRVDDLVPPATAPPAEPTSSDQGSDA